MPQPAPGPRSFRSTFGPAPTRFAACRESGIPTLEHALAESTTLCGIPRSQVTVYRHLFVASGSSRCANCRLKAVDVTFRP